jgi:hypothetical protein
MPFVVTSTATPPIHWRCPTCRRTERYRCSERFRANANGKLVDVWLIYRCERCDQTKNITVVERTPVARVDRALLRAATDNDAATARRLARDVALLQRAGAKPVAGDEWQVEPDGDPSTLRFEEPLLVRLDAVLRAVDMDVAPCHAEPHLRTDLLRLWGGELELRPRRPR